MTPPAHDRDAHPSPRKRASWMPTRNRVLVPSARPGEPAIPGQPGEIPRSAPAEFADPGDGPVSDGTGLGHRAEERTDSGPHSGPITAPRETVPAPAVVPADAPGRRGIVSRWHLMRLGVLVVVAVVIAVSISHGRSPDASAEPTVQSFLLDWESGNYQQAAQLTTGNPATVASDLRTAYNQLDAAGINLNMGTISQSGHNAVARFDAAVDLGQSGEAWNYVGWFPLQWTAKGWKIEWSPADINRGLRQGTRLAVRTTLAPRAMILDAEGQPLQQPTTTYELGVQPGKLANPEATAYALASATGLGSSGLLAQIQSGSGMGFLPLVTLDPPAYAKMSGALRDVPGLIMHKVRRRLFDSIAGDVVGTVGTEVSSSLRAEGVAYQPGDTVGLSGLQQYYQRRLVGTPNTEVVVETSTGHVLSVLKKWSGPAAQPIRTTLSAAAQTSADRALATTSHPAAILAVQASTGKILADASQGGVDPLGGHYSPGQAFTIVSTAALLATGLAAGDPVPCRNASDVGGETFTNDPPARGMGAAQTFSKDFTHGCGTAFAGLSMRLSASGLSAAANGFGLGSSWHLPLATFGGSALSPGTGAQLAADTMGSGDVQMSPLGMALVAAQVDSGAWHNPSLILSPTPADPPAVKSDPSAAQKAALSDQVMSTLRGLMRSTVRSGDARDANLSGIPVYGQAGSAPMPYGVSGQPPTSSAHSTPPIKGEQAWWFVGYRGDVAFAILEVGKTPTSSPVPLAAHFLTHLPASLLTP
jgi:cell division protein FtsI/penicillin-binding protein 2